VKRLAADPSSGVARVLDSEQAQAAGGFPDALYVVGLKPGYRVGGSLEAPLRRDGPARGTHGYPPDVPDMDASFFIAGPGIAAGLDLGRIDMRDIAPTLARRLGIALPAAEGRDRLSAR
jgi:hypothetical protein